MRSAISVCRMTCSIGWPEPEVGAQRHRRDELGEADLWIGGDMAMIILPALNDDPAGGA